MHTGKYAIEDYSQLRHIELGQMEVDYEFTVDARYGRALYYR